MPAFGASVTSRDPDACPVHPPKRKLGATHARFMGTQQSSCRRAGEVIITLRDASDE